MTAPVAHEPGGGEGADFGAVRFAIKADSTHTNGAYSPVEAKAGSFVLVPRGAAIHAGEFSTEFRDRLAEELGMTYYDDITF